MIDFVQVGSKAPDFTAISVYDEEFEDITLSSYQNKKYVVLFFYPLDFTFVCPTEITAFSDRFEEFDELDILNNIYVHGANDKNKKTPVTLENSMTSDQCKRLMKSETKLQEFEYNAF